MSDVSFVLLIVAGIFLVGSIGEVVFERTRIPDVIWLIACGWLLGPVLGILDQALLLEVAPFFAAFALIVILFNGGASLKLDGIARAAPRALLLALSGFALAAAVVAALSMLARAAGLLPEAWTWLHGAMLGSILGGASSIIVMPAMSRSGIEPRIANLVNLESALTDALCVVSASACVVMLLRAGGPDVAPALLLAKSFGVAFGVGAGAGLLWLFLLHLLRDSEHAYPVTLAGLLLLYVLVEALGASAAMGILTFAVVVGNARLISRPLGMLTDIDLGLGVRGFHAQMSFIVKSFFFVLIGALLTPPWPLLALGALLALALLAARVPAVALSVLGAGFDAQQRALITISLPRGMAAGVLATVPAAAGVVATGDLPVIVFSCIVATIAIFAVGLPLTTRRQGPAGDGTSVPPAAAAPADGDAPAADPGALPPAGSR
jgi:cell volume regulation protein A